MPKPENIIGKGFDKRPQNINRTGKNRKTISTVNVELEKIGATEASKKDITSCYLRLIQLTIPELETIVKDANQPALIRIVGKAILSGKGFEIIEKMLDRTMGRPDVSKNEDNGDNKIIIEIVENSNSYPIEPDEYQTK